jgi:mannose-6-phosphate isomerase-like protein (cupin superfamily)
MAAQQAILVITPTEGDTWHVGGPITCKISSQQTAGAYTVLEFILNPQGGPPLHVHHREDELFYVVEGQCTVGTKEQSQQSSAGTLVRFPKGTPHFFHNESSVPCKLLITAIPGGLDYYFAEIAAALAANQPDNISAINQKYQIDFLPPS